jgi:hypothetical protein
MLSLPRLVPNGNCYYVPHKQGVDRLSRQYLVNAVQSPQPQQSISTIPEYPPLSTFAHQEKSPTLVRQICPMEHIDKVCPLCRLTKLDKYKFKLII